MSTWLRNTHKGVNLELATAIYIDEDTVEVHTSDGKKVTFVRGQPFQIGDLCGTAQMIRKALDTPNK